MKNLYFKSAVWDYVLVLAVAAALSYALLTCFYVSPRLQFGPLPAVVAALTLLGLFAIAASDRSMKVGIPLAVVGFLVVWAIAAALTPGMGLLVDDEQNYFIFTVCIMLATLGSFLLSRTRAGSALLFIVGVVLVAFVQFFYGYYLVACSIVFVAASLALLVFKNYQRSMRASTSVRKVAFAPGFAVALVTTALACGFGLVVWFGVIAPLDPPAANIKLITEYRALETVRVQGTSSVYQIPNLDMTSSETNDGERTTDDIKESTDGRQVGATGEDSRDRQNDSTSTRGMNFLGINLDVPDDLFDFQSHLRFWMTLLLVLLAAVLAALAYFIGRRLRRRRRLERFAVLGFAGQVQSVYLFLVDRFERVGLSVPEGLTLSEYATASAGSMAQFDEEAGVTFESLTADYVAASYGESALDASAAARSRAYYNAFWRACRKKIGNVKYFFKSFRL